MGPAPSKHSDLEQSEEGDLLIQETGGSTLESDDGLQAGRPRRPERVALAAGLLAFAGAATLLLASGRTAIWGVAKGADALSLQPRVAKDSGDAEAWATMTMQTGCFNWREIQLSRLNMPTADDCGAECRGTVGCIGYNYQFKDCDSKESLSKGTCYLWQNECEHVRNACWNNYRVNNPGVVKMENENSERDDSESDNTESDNTENVSAETESDDTESDNGVMWDLKSSGKGCANWMDITVGQVTVDSVDACAKSCAKSEDYCTVFGYQPDGDCTGVGAGAGTCTLYGGACEEEDNDCWELYVLKEDGEPRTPPPTTSGAPMELPMKPQKNSVLSEAAKEGDSELQLEDASKFSKGNVVVVYDSTHRDIAKVLLVGQHNNLLLSQNLLHSYANGAPVGGYPAGTNLGQEPEEAPPTTTVSPTPAPKAKKKDLGMLAFVQWTSHPDKCLNEDAGKDMNGANVNIFDCIKGEENQHWYMPSDLQGPISWGKNSGKCLHVVGGPRAGEGANVAIYMCVPGEVAQTWQVPDKGKGSIIWGSNPTLCLEVGGGSTDNGANVQIGTCADESDDTSMNQQWNIARAELMDGGTEDSKDGGTEDSQEEQEDTLPSLAPSAEDGGTDDSQEEQEDTLPSPTPSAEDTGTEDSQEEQEFTLPSPDLSAEDNGSEDSQEEEQKDTQLSTTPAVEEEQNDALPSPTPSVKDVEPAPAPLEDEDEDVEPAPAPVEDEDETNTQAPAAVAGRRA